MEITISRLKEIIKEEIGSYKNDVLLETPAHFCATHVRENATGRAGRCIDHNWNETLQEVTAYDVDFGDEVIKNVPISELTILQAKNEGSHGGHMAKRDEDEVLDEEVEELEEGGAADRPENTDKKVAAGGYLDRGKRVDEVDITKNLDPEDRGPVDQTKNPDLSKKATQKAVEKKKNESIEEAIAAEVDNLLIEMGLLQPKKPLTLEEQIANLVDSYLPKVDEKALEETSFAYNEEKEEVSETKSLGDTIKEAVEEAVKAVVENNPVEPVIEEETETVTEETEAVTEETEAVTEEEKVEEAQIKTSIKEWYNNEKFEALKKKWAK